MIKHLQNAELCFNVDSFDVILLVLCYVNQSETTLQSDVASFGMEIWFGWSRFWPFDSIRKI